MRAWRAWLNAVIALAGGALFGFLFLGEFALIGLPPVMAILVVFALLTLAGALRHAPRLSIWSLFLLTAMIAPLVIEGNIVGLPQCGGDLAVGAACVGSGRDYHTPFYVEVSVFIVALIASGIHVRRTLWTRA